MKKTIFVCFVAAIVMTAWKQPADNVTVDTLTSKWNNAWNNHEARAIMNLMDDNVVFFAGRKTRMKGKQEIKEKFVDRNYKYITNLTTQKVAEKMFANSAFQYAEYHHDVLDDNGKIVASSDGNCSFVWEKNKKGEWKVIAFEIEEHPIKE